jgi:Lactonase, 7-bladed beta-propeller
LVLIAFLTLAAASFFISIADISAKSLQRASPFYLLYLATYTDTKSKGIYGYRFDAATGQLITLGMRAEIENPPYVVTAQVSHLLRSASFRILVIRDAY